jgi:hypothetical protein
VKTISREDLKEKIDRGDEFVLLEVLSENLLRAGPPTRCDPVPGYGLDSRPPA